MSSTASPNNFNRTPIICPHCNTESGYSTEGLMLYVLTSDLHCNNCGEVVIHESPIYSTLGEISED